MLPYQLALAGLALVPVCRAAVPLPPAFWLTLLSDFLGSPFFPANFLAFSFSFVGVAVARNFFFSGVALGFGDAFFLGIGLGERFGEGFGTALGVGLGCGVAAGIWISLFAGAEVD